ncbi:SDR family oxidoreductase [Ideonella sp. YS5]|uniref:SDR family oxidoreductase n=1 Tax=Ideonella sp. YS5 TaxID=3453714 RepID=UPI003EEDB394
MRILLTGATGFIGRHVADKLESAGHEVVRVGRSTAGAGQDGLSMDLSTVPPASAWLPALAGIDVVINAVGIFRERGQQTFDRLHVAAPSALFEACAQAGVRRVIHFSALGADAHARSRYHLSKRAGDEALVARGLDSVVLQPSLVFGLDGKSSRLFLQLAAAPVHFVPDGAGLVQPVHVDDVAELVLRLVEGVPLEGPARLAVVGPAALPWEGYLQVLRAGMGLDRARVWRVPRRWVDAVAWAAARLLPGSLLESDAWKMLQRGNVAPVDRMRLALGRLPRGVERFIAPEHRQLVLTRSRLLPSLVLLRWSIAAVWVGTAIVSSGPYPVADSLALLERVGAHGAVARLLLFGAAGLDLVLGFLTLAWPRRALWCVQIGLIVFYSALISWRLPEYWLHPYGPMLKNLPMLAGLCLLMAVDGRRR